MGLFGRIFNRSIDVIEWADTTNDDIIWKFPRQDKEIKMAARLNVRESQVAIFMTGGKIADVFGPGIYQLNPQNMPILTTLKGWKPGFKSPFKAGIYFVSTRMFLNQKWSTQNPVILRDTEFGPVRLRADGTYNFSIIDAKKFLAEIAAANPGFSTEDVAGQLRNLVVSQGMDSIISSQTPMQDLARNYDELSKLINKKIQPGFEEMGVNLAEYQIGNISLPSEIRQALDERSKVDIIDSSGVNAQSQAANVIERSAENSADYDPGTTDTASGADAGQAENDLQQDEASNNTAPEATMPPVPPTIRYFVVLRGKSEGPYSFEQLTDMAQNQTINANTLVWKKGMPAWATANTVEDVAGIF